MAGADADGANGASGAPGAGGASGTGRRPMRPRGRPLARAPRARPGPNDMGLVAGVVALVGLSAWGLLAPSPYAALAPIRLPDVQVAASPVPAPAAVDPQPLGSLGAPRGGGADPSVSVLPSSEGGGVKVIEVQPSPSAPGPIVVRDPSDLRQPQRIAHLPDRALIEDTDGGPLPVAASGRRPLDVYAGRWSGRRGNRIALVVGGIGISQTGTDEALRALPPAVTLGFSPQGNSLRRWMEAARRRGHEIVLQLPMQAFGRSDADPREMELRSDVGDLDNAARLRRALSRTTNYVGVMNYTGGAFLADRDALYPVAQELRDRGLMLLDDGSSAQSRADEVAGDLGLPFAAADAAIDLDRDPGEIEGQLRRLEELARGTGSAIGVASAFPETIEAIERWIAGVEARGFEIVPVSALARDPAGR